MSHATVTAPATATASAHAHHKVAPENIRNVALVGHNGTGKTTLTEALLFAGGAIRKKGTIAEKNTVSDFDPDESRIHSRGGRQHRLDLFFKAAGRRRAKN